MDKNTQDLLETVLFIKENMATKDDVHKIVNKAVDAAKIELRAEMHEGFTGIRGRLGDLEKVQEEILDEMRPLSRAHSADAVTIVQHESRITRIEEHLALSA